jgi:hypothetical protein
MNRMFLYMALLALVVAMRFSALLSRQITLPITWLSRQMKKGRPKRPEHYHAYLRGEEFQQPDPGVQPDGRPLDG